MGALKLCTYKKAEYPLYLEMLSLHVYTMEELCYAMESSLFLLDATVKLRDGKSPTDMEFSFIEKLALKKALSKIQGTDLEKLLKEYHIL